MNKKESEKKKQTKKLEKQKRKEIRKVEGGGKSFEDMIAYVDENGNITDTPPDPKRVTKIDVENIAISTPKQGDIEEEPMQGRVEHYNNDKGYGFIKDLKSIQKYFFHINNAPAAIKEGDKVTFDLERGQKGMNAVNISIIVTEKQSTI